MTQRIDRRWIAVLVAAVALIVPAVAYAQATEDQGLLLRIGGDVTVDADETVETLIVLDGNAVVRGTIEDIVVVSGDVTLESANVRNLTVVSGDASLVGSTVIREDVHLVDGTIDRAASVDIQGSVREDTEVGFGAALGVISVLIYLGVSVAFVVLALVIAAVAGRQANDAGRAITNSTGTVVVSTVMLWVFLPIAAVLAFATVIGIPTGIMILAMVMPAIAVIGYAVGGIRVGTWLLYRNRGDDLPRHPYLAAFVGVGALQLIAWVPFLGFLIATIVGLAGSGAIALLAWRAFRDSGRPVEAEPTAEPAPGS